MTLDHVKTLAEEAKELRARYLGKVGELRRAVRDADAERDGEGRNELARAAEPGLSRRLVYEVLGAEDLRAKAGKIVKATDPRFEVFQVDGVGSVKLSTLVNPEPFRSLFDVEDYEDGTVEDAARDVVERLEEAGVKVPANAAEELADYGTVKLS